MTNLGKLGHRIRLLRIEKGLSQENMANDLGISLTAYSRIERGKTNISILRLEQIAEALGVSTLKITHPKAENKPDAILVRDDIRRYGGEFDTVTLVDRIRKQESEIAQLYRILADKEDIIALLKEKLEKQ
jgi:transcriptional regulator with XRE-family HTH domain